MDREVMLTAVSGNDPSCNVYTLTETRTVKFLGGLTEQQSGHLADGWGRDMFGGRRRRPLYAGLSSSPLQLMMGRENAVLLPRGFERYTSPSKSSRREAEESRHAARAEDLADV